MIITREQLEDIEKTIGHSCVAGVTCGLWSDSIKIRFSVEQPDGQMYKGELLLTGDDYTNGLWDQKIGRFKRWGKRNVNTKFKEFETLTKRPKWNGVGDIHVGDECTVTRRGDMWADTSKRPFIDAKCLFIKFTRGGLVQVSLASDNKQVCSIPMTNVASISGW